MRGTNLSIDRRTLFSVLVGVGLTAFAFGEGTRTWEQSKFDELSKGTAKGVAVRSTGGLQLAPAFKQLYTTPSTYIWSIAADNSGTLYAATGARPAFTASPRMAKPAQSSSLRNFRSRLSSWTTEARSTPPPPRTASSIRSSRRRTRRR